jgi:hypothetical protein
MKSLEQTYVKDTIGKGTGDLMFSFVFLFQFSYQNVQFSTLLPTP